MSAQSPQGSGGLPQGDPIFEDLVTAALDPRRLRVALACQFWVALRATHPKGPWTGDAADAQVMADMAMSMANDFVVKLGAASWVASAAGPVGSGSGLEPGGSVPAPLGK